MGTMRSMGWCAFLAALGVGCGDPDKVAPSGTGAASGAGGSGGLSGAGGTGGSSAGSGASGGSGAGTAGVASGGSSGSSGGSGGSSGSAGAGGTSGSAGAGKGSPSGSIQFGTIYNFPTVGQVYAFATARFDRGDAPPSTAVCTTQTFGPCSLHTCEASTDPPDPTVWPHAGTITIQSDDGAFNALLGPDTVGVYSTQGGSLGSLSGGETVTVEAQGGEVPEFSHVVSFPLVLLLTSPALAAGESTVTASRGDDLVLAWDRGIEGLNFVIQTTNGTPFVCSVPSVDGAMTIPAAALSALPANTGLLLIGSAVDSVTAGDYDVSISYANGVMNPDRSQRVDILVP